MSNSLRTIEAYINGVHYQMQFQISQSHPDEIEWIKLQKERKDGTFNPHADDKPVPRCDMFQLRLTNKLNKTKAKYCLYNNVKMPMTGIKHANFDYSSKDIKVLAFNENVHIPRDRSGNVRYWRPTDKESIAKVINEEFLQKRPLSLMGFALQIAQAGPDARSEFSDLLTQAFGTIEHPFRPIWSRELEEGIREAYCGVSHVFWGSERATVFNGHFFTFFSFFNSSTQAWPEISAGTLPLSIPRTNWTTSTIGDTGCPCWRLRMIAFRVQRGRPRAFFGLFWNAFVMQGLLGHPRWV